MYTQNEDLHIQEYAAGILGELTRDIRGCDLLLKQDVIATIFRRINSTDADVQRNTLEVSTIIIIFSQNDQNV